MMDSQADVSMLQMLALTQLKFFPQARVNFHQNNSIHFLNRHLSILLPSEPALVG
jgi:hypothetical protein